MPHLSRPSVQSLLIQTQVNGEPLTAATGFVVTSKFGPTLITNRHILTGRDQNTGQPLAVSGEVPTEVVVIHNRKGVLGQWVARAEPLYDGPVRRWHEHPVLGPKADIVALRLTNLADVDCYPYDIADPGPDILLGPSDPVSIVGFPFGQTGSGGMLPIWSNGFLASEPSANFLDLPIQLVDSRTLQGQSGAPVIAYRSGGDIPMNDGTDARFAGPVLKFVGLYGGRVNAQSDLGVVWKSAAIQELINAM